MNENNQLAKIDEGAVLDLARIVETGAVSAAELRSCVTEFARLIVAFKGQMDAMQRDIQSKVTISAAQARALQEAVRGRALALCEAKGLSYTSCGKALREAIWREFYAEFAIGSRYDLPAYRFKSALQFINDWNSLAVVRRLRDKYGG